MSMTLRPDRHDPGTVLTATLREPTEGEATGRRVGAVSLRYTRGELVTRAAIEPPCGATRLLGGRHPPADLVIDDPAVSGAHFELEFTGERVILRDLGSTNGTWIYGVRVREVELAYGARFSVGSVVIEVERAEQVDVAIGTAHRFDALLGKSAPMLGLYAVLRRLALAGLDVLVTGETGTGKELVARALHRHSSRAAGPFIVLDCSTLPRDLAEAAILGHAAGAFTGATRARAGAFEDAHGGTIFLDEVGELPAELQAKLLRVLAERSVTRIGETAARPIDVRVVTATHRDLRMMVLDRQFREDVYYRLAQFTVLLPPLRERGVDIELLARAFLAEYSVGFEGHRDFTPDALASLRAHPWPGNVRELRNVIMRAAQMTTTALIECSDLALAQAELGRLDDARTGSTPGMPIPMELARTRFERDYLHALLEHCDGNVSKAARVANMSRRGLYAMMLRVGMTARADAPADREDDPVGGGAD
jgi:DNA-binding NtrC family response regulator